MTKSRGFNPDSKPYYARRDDDLARANRVRIEEEHARQQRTRKERLAIVAERHRQDTLRMTAQKAGIKPVNHTPDSLMLLLNNHSLRGTHPVSSGEIWITSDLATDSHLITLRTPPIDGFPSKVYQVRIDSMMLNNLVDVENIFYHEAQRLRRKAEQEYQDALIARDREKAMSEALKMVTKALGNLDTHVSELADSAAKLMNDFIELGSSSPMNQLQAEQQAKALVTEVRRSRYNEARTVRNRG